MQEPSAEPVEVTENEEVETDATVLRNVLHRQERETKRLANKPYIDHLEDAIIDIDGVPSFMVATHKKVIIERYASVLASRPWLDTRSYIIVAINQVTGDLKLLDDMGQQCSSNYITGPTYGYRFKIPEGEKPLPRRNKAAPKVSQAEKAKVKAEKPEPLRRIYVSKNIIHTRIKGQAYVPSSATQAKDGDRLTTKLVKDKLQVKHPEAGWEETWIPTKDL